jgi:hypothetical protein
MFQRGLFGVPPQAPIEIALAKLMVIAASLSNRVVRMADFPRSDLERFACP